MRYLVFSLALLWMLTACSRSEKSNSTATSPPEPVPTETAATPPPTEPETARSPVASAESTSSDKSPTTRPGLRLTNFKAATTPQAQDFRFDPDQDQVVRCQHGTRIAIPANAFTFEDGTPVTEPVSFEVKEFYTKSDYVLTGLGTRSDDRMLESGGMLHLAAWSEGQKLKVAEGKQLDIALPHGNTPASTSEGMQVFVSDNAADTPPDNWVSTSTRFATGRRSLYPATLLVHKGGAHQKVRYFRGEWEVPQYDVQLLSVKARSWAINISKLAELEVNDGSILPTPADNYANLEEGCDQDSLPEVPMSYKKDELDFVVKKHKYARRFYQYSEPKFVRYDTIRLALEVSANDRWYGLDPDEYTGERWEYRVSTFKN